MTTNSVYKIEFIDPRFDSDKWEAASRKRIFLAYYIDYIFLSVLIGWIDYLLRTALVGYNGMPFYMPFTVLSLIEFMLHKMQITSPGHWFLSMRLFEVRLLQHDLEESRLKPLAFTDKSIKSGESWLTILFAVTLLNEGGKGLVRWTMWNGPMPFFGITVTNEIVYAIVFAIIGTLECYIAYGIFTLRAKTFIIGIAYAITTLISTIMSWPLWDKWVQEVTMRRRSYQEMPIREGEIEFMQRIMPELLIMILLLYMAVFLIIRKRLVNNN